MTSGLTTIDLACAWNWEYDREFMELLQMKSRDLGITTYLIERKNIEETLRLVREGTLKLRFLLDRASDDDEAFQPLAHFLAQDGGQGTCVINPFALQSRAADKATMHLEFLTHGIQVPYTLIISPYNQRREAELSLTELAKLGRPFIIKPANTTGGGIGVVTGAETLKDVLEARQHHKNDKYLLQETMKPASLSENRAWFRVFYAFGDIIPCWWDDQTHVYEEITEEDLSAFGLEELMSITQKIFEVCRLDFFSTELVLTAQLKFVSVDYVNEVCDMRPQSRHRDGVPDRVIGRIVGRLLQFVKPSPVLA